MKPQVSIPILLILIISCAPFSQQVTQDVKREIVFSEVVKDPEAFKGEAIIWGGVIIETITRPNDTLIIVSQTELDWHKQPKDLDTSTGRFIIHCRGFLDPAIYSKNREVTVEGRIAGKEERLVGEYRFAYPVIESESLRLWETWRKAPYYYDPWYWEPFPLWWPYYPYHHRHHHHHHRRH
jgi:outer membrane lipoprotein